ncbi:hypothetical protein BDA96_01G301800 [Sorghum bicolor]|uniref:No apical meristem-associated C-terminal domain-containing protein n=1 Tax=Sorghum bicolor TaxID=4558 RepID=A0A921S266_SORBI|nr:hypothetical protein BDA96_01G301800 [Sorghum bicolor]
MERVGPAFILNEPKLRQVPATRHLAKRVSMAALCMEADGKGWGWMPSGFAKCLSSPSAWHLEKRPFRQVRFFAECLALGEAFFAKCSIFGTRRTLGHLAKPGFPVVTDPVIGIDRKGEYYWKAVATEFNNNAPKNSHKRTIRQLMKHWGDVKRDITKFSGAYARAMNARSCGQSDDMVLKAAHEFFKNGNNGRSFIYEYLWEVAKEMPKWRRIIKEESTSKRTKVSKSGAYTSSSNQDTEGETMSREVRPEGQKKAKARLKGAGKSAAPSPLSNQPSQNMVMYHEAMTMKAKSARAKKYNTYLKMLAIDTSNFNKKEKTRHDSILDQIAKDLAED